MPTLIGRFVASPALFVCRGVKVVWSRNNGKTPEMLGEKAFFQAGNQV
jgi:hypothetical protein